MVGQMGLSVYYNPHSEFSLEDGCILRRNRVVIPPAGRDFILSDLHEVHQVNITKMQ